MGTGGEKRKELGAKEGGRAEQGSPGGLGLAQEEGWGEAAWVLGVPLNLSYPARGHEVGEMLLEKISRRKNLTYFPLTNLRIFRIRKTLVFIRNLQRKEQKTKKPSEAGAIRGVAIADSSQPVPSSGLH